MREVIIMRGLPGSGKSTYIKENLHVDAPDDVVSADHYFMRGGEYQFDPAELPDAHRACMARFIDLCRRVTPPRIVVDNTNVSLWEMSPYVAVAEACGYKVRIIYVTFPWATGELARRTVHGVPEEAIFEMAQRWEDPLPWWNQEKVQAVRTLRKGEV